MYRTRDLISPFEGGRPSIGIFRISNGSHDAKDHSQNIRRGNGNDQPETLRLIAVGSLESIQITIMSLYNLGYAEPNDWSKPLPTGRGNEMMAILTKKITR